MPSVRYFDQTAPFWDFVASFEQQTASQGESADKEFEHANPWSRGFAWGPFPHRGHHDPQQHHGPSPHQPDVPSEQDPGAGPSEATTIPDGSHRTGHQHAHGPHHGGPWARGGLCGRGRGRGGRGFGGARGWGCFHPYAMAGPWGAFAEMMQTPMFSEEHKDNKNDDFKPEADVFDTADAFVIHVSLPGAKKEDVGVSWDAEKSELSVAGVIYRPGDEEFLKTLALDERKVGVFKRKVRLGSRANPAQVDGDAITAKLENGILAIDVPKLDSGYVEIKQVDIE